MLPILAPGPHKTCTFEEFQQKFTNAALGEFREFWHGEIKEELQEMGLLVV
jgi:hypothetical protein